MADVLNFPNAVAMQVKDIQLLQCIQLFNAHDLIFSKHKNLNSVEHQHIFEVHLLKQFLETVNSESMALSHIIFTACGMQKTTGLKSGRSQKRPQSRSVRPGHFQPEGSQISAPILATKL